MQYRRIGGEPLNVRPFRFGINVFNATSRQEWQSKARKAEDLGYSSFLVADHLWVFPPIVGLMEAAEATTRLRVGSYVFANDFRHPILLAREAAAIDLMSNGRLEFGLGTGYHVGDYQPAGFTFDTPGIRVSRFEEAVQVIKGVWEISHIRSQESITRLMRSSVFLNLYRPPTHRS